MTVNLSGFYEKTKEHMYIRVFLYQESPFLFKKPMK